MKANKTPESEHSERPVEAHLEQALDASDEGEKNFHVRQAMQLLITGEDR